MNLPNQITLSRLPLLFMTVIALYFKTRWGATVGFILYIFASWTDWLDGYIARKYKYCSTLGAFMDALLDKIFTLGVFTTMLVLKILPDWSLFAVLLIITREFTITGLRTVAASKNVVIKAQGEGKIKTALQMVSTGFLLAWFALKRDFFHRYTLDDISWVYWTGLIMFLGATVITVVSGVIYMVRFGFVLKDSK